MDTACKRGDKETAAHTRCSCSCIMAVTSEGTLKRQLTTKSKTHISAISELFINVDVDWCELPSFGDIVKISASSNIMGLNGALNVVLTVPK